MGPAYLIDVIGLDISDHVVEIVSAGFADRMEAPSPSAIDLLKNDDRLGQKNGRGFYLYARDPKGRPRKDCDSPCRRFSRPGSRGAQKRSRTPRLSTA